MSTYVQVARVEDIPPLGGRCVQTERGPIGLFRTADDRIFAVHNRCPHRGGPLSEGIVHGTSVTCPLHNMVVSLETGDIVGPDEGGVATIPVRVTDGEISIGLPERLARRPVPATEPSGPDLDESADAVVARGVAPTAMPNTAARRVAPKESV